MSILTVVQQASMPVGLARPLSLFGNTNREWMEMQEVVNEAASIIVQSFDWQRLKRQHVIIGDGASLDFPMPEDYRRMLRKGSIWSSRYQWQTQQIVDLDTWTELSEPNAPAQDGIWTIYGDRLHFLPRLGNSETIKFFYVKDKVCRGPDEAPAEKAAFEDDGDTFLLNERLLKLCIIYLWKQSKGQDFAAELADYEQAADQYMVEDKGSQPVVTGNSGYRPTSNVWPGKVSG